MSRYLLQHLLEASAARRPESPAVRLGEQAITYRELSEQSNRLARALVAAGFGPRNPVGVLLDKSIEAIVAFFGIACGKGILMARVGATPKLKRSYAFFVGHFSMHSPQPVHFVQST